jgi:hypothetical protein
MPPVLRQLQLKLPDAGVVTCAPHAAERTQRLSFFVPFFLDTPKKRMRAILTQSGAPPGATVNYACGRAELHMSATRDGSSLYPRVDCALHGGGGWHPLASWQGRSKQGKV